MVVVPDDVTLEDCLTTDKKQYQEVVERVVNVYEILYKIIFNKKGLAMWLETASTEDFTFSCDTFIKVFDTDDCWDYFLTMPWDKKGMKEKILDINNSIFGETLPLLLGISGGNTVQLDIHFGVLQPIRDDKVGQLCEIMESATPWPGFTHTFKQSVQTFFIAQCKTLVNNLSILYTRVILDPKGGSKDHDNSLARTMKGNAAVRGALVKAEKRMMRINELVNAYPNTARTKLQELYSVHDKDMFQPVLHFALSPNNYNKVGSFLQTSTLKNTVREFNQYILWGKDNSSIKNIQKKIGKEATQSELAKALCKPLRNMMAMLHVREGNEVSGVFILTDDVSVAEMIHLVMFMFERLRDKVDSVMRRVHALGIKSKTRSKTRKTPAAQEETAADNGEEKRGEGQFAREIHAFKLMNRMNLRF